MLQKDTSTDGVYSSVRDEHRTNLDDQTSDQSLSWMTVRCRASVGPFGVTCKGRMEYDHDAMEFVCTECGNTEDLL